ncbi:hypothetical protein FZC83_01800 [Rossellomorea marisflavi]|uniref:Uncharacterized protein n=1 Tax=Rossellomorea marisflavi TaxID=189381 RepID=A0A5D4S069_9BACI|nr:hypothetical protein [Rossellomorea marisflavi]TYS56329.1 hypothetical protein FZC83_01800 [Rossellomorea marisflavi]
MSYYAHTKYLVKVIMEIEEDGLYSGMYGDTHVNKGDLVVRDELGYEYTITKAEFAETYLSVAKEKRPEKKAKNKLTQHEIEQMMTGYAEMGEIIKLENEARKVELHNESDELLSNKAL